MWTASGALALHALRALQLTLGVAEVADVGLHLRSIELKDVGEGQRWCDSSRCFQSGCKFTSSKVRLEDEDIEA